MVILNDGTPTRITPTSESAIDLTICSPSLNMDVKWNVLNTQRGSDHCVIAIEMEGAGRAAANSSAGYNVKRANWEDYRNHPKWREIEENSEQEPTIDKFYHYVNTVARDTIPQHKISFYPKPWWNEELHIAKRDREQAYRKYRNHKTLTNMLAWKKLRATFKYKVKQYKRESLIKMTSSINSTATPQKVYDTIRRIKGRRAKSMTMIIDNGRIFRSTLEIINKIADTFSEISSTRNYTSKFNAIRIKEEQHPLNFASNNKEVYNQAITIHELHKAIENSKNTTPGSDHITREMIRNTPYEAKQFLLKILNRLYTEAIFPDQWRHSHVIPIPKPDKNHSIATNYRPIALTSTICKIMERILNIRLLDWLEMEGKISAVQCGGKAKRSTIDHLIRLETTIRTAFAKREHLIAIFFDVEKAYDTTWKYGIMKDLYLRGLRGHLPRYIEQFLRDRTFQVKAANELSAIKSQYMGVPQGSVLSVTLFIIKIDSITQLIPQDPRLQCSLYVDDLQISYRHIDIDRVQTELQDCLGVIGELADQNGFRFSPSKTKAVKFTNENSVNQNYPKLYINQQEIKYAEFVKFLGVTFDARLNWAMHINSIKLSCQKPLNLLKFIASQKYGADQKTLMNLYRALIRSKIEYGAVIYHSANNKNLEPLNLITNPAMRLATGAFRSTPTKTLQTLANEMPLRSRSNKLAINYYFKTRSQLSNPCFRDIVATSQSLLFKNKK